MNAPTLDALKAAIEAKGFGDLFEVESKPAKNNISGEIPLDFLYKIVMDQRVIDVIKGVFEESAFDPDAIPDMDVNMEIIQKILDEIDRQGLLPDEEPENPEQGIPGPISKLLFAGVRVAGSLGVFNDWLVVTNRDGSVFETFEVCTDVDFRPASPVPSDLPILTKPGFYKDLFTPALTTMFEHHCVVQCNEIDLFSAAPNEEGLYDYVQVMRGNFALSIGCSMQGPSTAELIRSMFCVELKYHADCDRLLNTIADYKAASYLIPNQVYVISGVKTLVIGDMNQFSYLLLDERDLN